MDIIQILTDEFKIKKNHTENIISLLNEGNTVPFIARYRKEMTGSADDVLLREFYERYGYLTNLEQRKTAVQNAIEEQGKLTDDITKAIDMAVTLQEVEDIYAPYRQKKKTRASVARAKGLEPLAISIMKGETDIEKEAKDYINEELDVESEQNAIAGAMDILAEMMSEDFELKKELRKMFFDHAVLNSTIKKGAEENENAKTYKMYFDFTQKAYDIPAYRVLAINRGEKQDILKVKLDCDMADFEEKSAKKYPSTNQNAEIMQKIIKDSLTRLILPSLERELRSDMTERAEESAIDVFGKNLSALLMQAPVKDKVVMGWDPAFRTGCKIAVVDKTGKVIDTATVYPTAPQNKVEETTKQITDMIKKNKVDIISIGNGTASRESEKIVSDILKPLNDVYYTIVSEAGASVYSASELAVAELPDLNVSIRGAVSIARRLQDPMSELVKIDPKSIGVGQYQHDVNAKRLDEVLTNVVVDNVNKVGIDINTASYSALSYVSGITPSIAKNIVKYRDENGKFIDRKQLLNVPRLGKQSYRQCVGFLRVKDGENILDNTGIHPETYEQTEKLIETIGLDIKKDDFTKEFTDKIKTVSQKDLSEQLQIGLPTLIDIIKELQKPGLDVRDEKNIKPQLRSDILKLEDLSDGMVLRGTVRNVTQFGAFVDVGLKNDGLVHISKLSNKYIKDPSDVVSVGDIVDVKVIGVDYDTGKISLSMRDVNGNE